MAMATAIGSHLRDLARNSLGFREQVQRGRHELCIISLSFAGVELSRQAVNLRLQLRLSLLLLLLLAQSRSCQCGFSLRKTL